MLWNLYVPVLKCFPWYHYKGSDYPKHPALGHLSEGPSTPFSTPTLFPQHSGKAGEHLISAGPNHCYGSQLMMAQVFILSFFFLSFPSFCACVHACVVCV